jgi:hypothetical protein
MKRILLFLNLIIFCSCGKEFLEKKQNASLVIPETIAELQSLLDDTDRTINSRSCNELGLIGSDEFYISEQSFNNLPASAKPYEKLGYYWHKSNVYEGTDVRDWDFAYRRILYANTVLEGINKIRPTQSEQNTWDNVKGSALFVRAHAFYQLAQEFCKPYQSATASTERGIPLRLIADITAKSFRSSVQETYAQIVTDLNGAVDLLPETPLVKYRPSKVAAHALLAKAYLLMSDYNAALKHADLSLAINKELIDYNTLNLNASYCFPTNMEKNPEILYISYILNIPIFQTTRARIPLTLYNLYNEIDLGKKACFTKTSDGSYSFKGSYFGGLSPLFTGICTDEIILIKAECLARNNRIAEANTTLNYLLKNRYESAKFIPLTFTDKRDILIEIINQRKKRLILRGIRWEDLRRLNQEPEHAITLRREINSVVYELQPQDLRYTWPFPDKAIEFGGYQQNER